MEANTQKFVALRKKLINGLESRFEGKFTINGPQNDGVPHIINIGFKTDGNQGLDGEMLLLNLDIEGVCVSNGSACTSGATEPSHVLQEVVGDEAITNSSIRVSFGKQNSEKEIDFFLDKLEGVLDRMMKVAS